MLWVSIVLGILQLIKDLPQIETVVKSILEKLRGHPIQGQHATALLDILHAHQAGATHAATEAAVHALHAQL